MFAFSRTDFSGNGVNSDSPLHLQERGNTLGFGVIWTIGRSSQLVND
jgi:hypothetical protein